jgi:DNA repair protein RecN (Recombination protein N)
MLTELHVRNLAIIDALDVTFDRGLTVITGETGAGKSILVAALQLVLGGRASPEVVRAGAERAEVEALFAVSPEQLARAGVDFEAAGGELVVRRTVHAGGRSRATIDGRLATATELQALAGGLVDIASQHEHHALGDPATHLATLDAYAGHADRLAALGAAWAAAVDALGALRSLQTRARDRADRQDLLEFQLAEVRRLDPRPGELPELEESASRSRHADRLRRATAGAEHALYGRERALCAELARIEHELDEAAALDPALALVAAQVRSARAELEDAAQELGRYARRVDADPDALARAEERIAVLKRLARRHGDLDALVAWRDAAERELSELADAEHHLERLAAAAETARGVAGALAEALSVSRRRAADALGQAIAAELGDLGMGGAEVEVEVAPLGPGGDLEHAGARLGVTGIDRVELLIAPNPGEPPRPLRRIASGGELSRSLLAIRRVLSATTTPGTHVFDEVDAGVGGAVADAIGRKLAEVARHHQVICITHLPQIAAYGDAHLVVAKDVEGGRTASRVRRLDEAGRVEELARMLGGRRVTEAARDAARALLSR